MDFPWKLTRAPNGSLSLIDANDPAAADHPVATCVKPSEANLLRVAPVMRGVLSEMNAICVRMFAALPADRARRELLERADAALKASHVEEDGAPPAPPSAPRPVLSEKDIEDLAHEALDAACLLIQDRLGVTTGDLAGVFFSTEDPGGFKTYIRSELHSIRRGDYDGQALTQMHIDGFELRMTGGNCTALVDALPDGRNIVLTAAGGASAFLEPGEGVTVGVYPNEEWDPDAGTILELPSFDAAGGAVAAILAEPGHLVYVANSAATQGVTAAIEAGLSRAIGWSLQDAPADDRRSPSPRG
jgi:hypothetical protein